MKYPTFLFLLTLFVTVGSAQDRLRLVMDTKPVGSVIRVSKYMGDMVVALDSLRYRGEAEVAFPYDNRYTDGVYLIDIGSIESFQFVLVAQENINGHIYENGSGMAFKADLSKENDAFNIMLNLSDVYTQSMDTLSIAMNNLSDFDPRHAAISDSLSQTYHRIAEAYNNSLELLNNLFPESYAAQVLVPLDRIPLRTQRPEWNHRFDNDAAFNHVHYFSLIDFSDERIISNPYLSNKVLDYLYHYTERSEQGVKEGIDKLVGLATVDPKVEAFMLDLLVDFFTEKNAAEFVDHLHRNYLGNCELPLSAETLAKIHKMVKFEPGDAIPDIRLPDPTGHTVSMTGLDGELNVVVFWATWCPHCMREMPKLKALYDQMQGKLGVYAVSIDTSQADWKRTISSQGLTWLNVMDDDAGNGALAETFGLVTTPALFLLDSQHRWIGRASSYDGLHQLVRAQMEE